MTAERPGSETGAFIIIWAVLVVALMTMVAIVLDLGALRQDRRANRSAADAAATAGAFELGGAGPLAACTAAWQSLSTNLSLTSAASPCSAAFSATCTAGSEANATVGDYNISIKVPVADTDPYYMQADAVGGLRNQTVVPAVDGTNSCERIGVRIRLIRRPTFARVIGADSRTTDSHSVALYRSTSGASAEAPALVALDQTACETVSARTGFIRAESVGLRAAIMRSDSDGSGCADGSYVMTTQNNSNGSIEALPGSAGQLGELGYFAPDAKAYRPPGNPARYIGQLKPLPTRTTRNPVDEIYRCTISKDGCAPTQIDYYQATLFPLNVGPRPSFQQFPSIPGDDCSAPRPIFGLGNWFIACPTFTVSSTVNFAGDGTIIFDGKLLIKAGGLLQVNTTSFAGGTGLPIAAVMKDSLVVVRSTADDAISVQSSSERMWLSRTLLYNLGGMAFGGGPTVRWTAPEESGGKDILSWNESAGLHLLSGGSVLRADGVFFAPNAKLSLAGSGTLDATNVQVWFNRFETQGSTSLLLRPNPNRSVKIPRDATQLIR